jgi:Mg2+/Co2+ transporter CorC
MKVKELMTPVDEYTSLDRDALIGDAVVALATSRHRDILVTDADGSMAGILTMTDLLATLEPSYKRLQAHEEDGETLTNKYVSDIFKEFGLWSDSLDALCTRCVDIRLGDAMYVPAETEFLDEEDSIEHGVHHYITGAHQPLIVRRGREVTGLLRLADVFEEIKKRITSCGC